MDEETEYKLIHAVNPTRVKIPIREKFAKLTLSSNKKKQLKPQDDVQLEKRKSASRNLMEQLNNTETEKEIVYTNPILRSSSSFGSSENMLASIKKVDGKLLNTSDAMEPLQISEILTQPTYNTVDLLSEQMSEMFVSVTSSNKIKTEDSVSLCPGTVKNIKSEYGVICVSSSSTSEDDECESVISLSDSSTQNEDYNSVDYSLMTSDIPKSGETANFALPNTLSNENADRIETYLRDVAKEFKERGTFEELNNSDINKLDAELYSSKVNSRSKAQHVASLDTMSMSAGEENLDFTQDNLTIPMSQNHSSIFTCNSALNSNESLRSGNNDSKRLASDETEINTFATILNSSHNQSSVVSESSNKSSTLSPKIDIVEDSIVIPETASEAESSRSSSYTKNDISVQPEASDNTSPNTQDSHMSPVSISMGKINISARINIRIQLSQVENNALDDSPSNSSKNNSIHTSTSDANDNSESVLGTESSPNVVACEQGQKSISDNKDKLDSWNTPKATTRDEVVNDDDEHFINSAEKLLNELYGKSWQTPDAIQTLKRTTCSTKSKTVQHSAAFKKPMTNNKTKRVTIEESILDDDFSIFRRNVASSNLNSTVLMPANQCKPKQLSQTERPRKKQQNGRDRCDVTKETQSEIKKQTLRTKSGRVVRERWRQLISDSSDSDGVNASDDMDIDETRDSGSEHSWSGKDGSHDDDDSLKRVTNISRVNRPKRNGQTKRNDKLVYLDLSKDEVTIYEGTPESPPANHDETFNSRLKEVLKSCSHKDKPKLEATPQSTVKTKRKLFTVNFDFEEDVDQLLPGNVTPKDRIESDDDVIADVENINILNSMDIVNKKLESVKTGKPIFKLTQPKSTTPTVWSKEKSNNVAEGTPKTSRKQNIKNVNYSQPWQQYSFLKSLDEKVSKLFCDKDALYYRENYRQKKEELARKLFDMYNEKLFENKLVVPLVWNKKLLNTAGRCMNKKNLGVRSSVIELSEKVLTSADRLRCTLIHELCHAATWIFNGEGGHGTTWKSWAHKANSVFPDIPKIGVCHQYDIEYKYTYKCILCGAKSHAHSKSRKVENIRCLYCHGAIEIYLNKKDKQGNLMATPVREPTGFAKFVKEKYNQFKRPDLKHADVMKILSNEFNALKLASKK